MINLNKNFSIESFQESIYFQRAMNELDTFKVEIFSRNLYPATILMFYYSTILDPENHEKLIDVNIADGDESEEGLINVLLNMENGEKSYVVTDPNGYVHAILYRNETNKSLMYALPNNRVLTIKLLGEKL